MTAVSSGFLEPLMGTAEGAPLFDVLAHLGDAAELRRAARTFDVREAARHGVSAMVADAFAAADVQLEPWARAALTRDAQGAIAAGLRVKRLTLAVLDALAARGVTPVLVKGPALAARLYPEQPLGRPSSDVDVLVARDEVEAAETALGALGLRRMHFSAFDDVFEEHHHLSFVGAPGLVELHYRLFRGFGGRGFDEVAVLARTRPFTLADREVRILEAEDEFAYLATHAANHSFLRASWLVDLQRYVTSEPNLDFAVMAERLREAGCHAAVATTLALLEELLCVQLSPVARREFELSLPRRLVAHRLFSAGNIVSAQISSGRLGSLVTRLVLTDSPAHGFRFVTDGLMRASRRFKNAS